MQAIRRQRLVAVVRSASVQAVRASDRAGASFAVSPSTDAAVIRAARDADMVSMPGAATPTEIVTAGSEHDVRERVTRLLARHG